MRIELASVVWTDPGKIECFLPGPECEASPFCRGSNPLRFSNRSLALCDIL